MRIDILRKLETDLVVSARQHPDWARALNSYRYRGRLASVLPGIYALPHRAGDFDVRVAAAARSPMGFICTGRTAARLAWWPELAVDVVDVACETEHLPQSGFAFHQRYISPSLTARVGGVSVTTAALTVLDLVTEMGTECIDEALRRRATTLPHLQAALAMTPRRRGNTLRREALADSRDRPWSALERRGHRLLREAGVRGWRSNHPVIAGGQIYYIDVALPFLKIAVEIDGFEFHGNREAFHHDRARDAALTAAGWHVIRFTAENLHDLPAVLRSLMSRRRVA